MKRIIIALVIINFLCSPATAMIKTPNLVGGWRFEGNANDWSGNGNNGTVSGATLATGKFGQAYSFNGVDDYVITNLYAADTFNSGSQFTISTWIKINESPGISKVGVVVGAAYYNGYGIVWESDSVGIVSLFSFFRDIPYGTKTTSIIPEIGRWYNLIQVYDGVNNFQKLYVDGALLSTVSGNSSSFIYPVEMGNIGINKDQIWAGDKTTGRLNCLIDEVRIYNRALTESEIRQDMLGYSPKEF